MSDCGGASLKPVLKSEFWTKAKDDHLRAFYNDQVHVDPAILAFDLRVSGGARRVVKRLLELGLRKSFPYP
jgi:hypothetical protein